MGKRQRDRKQQSRDEQQRAPAPESDQYEVILSDSLRAQLGGEAAVVGAKRGRGPADDAARARGSVDDPADAIPMSKAARRKLDQLLGYMRNRNVPLDLRKRVSGYCEFLWSRVQCVNEKELMGALPSSLQLQLAIVLNKTLFTRVPIFKDMEAQCIVAFVRHLRPLVLQKNPALGAALEELVGYTISAD